MLLLFRLIGEESRNKDGHLRLMIQPESNSLSSILSVHGNYACNTRIDHIVCLSSNPENVYRKRIIIWIVCGVCCHFTIIIMIIIPGIITVRFRCRRKILVFFPYMVLSSKYACVLTADMQKGYITAKPENIEDF